MIDATVRLVMSEESADLKSGEVGCVIAAPSDFSDSGQAYHAFIVHRSGPTQSQIDAAAYSLACFNRDLDHLRDYQIAIQKRCNDLTS